MKENYKSAIVTASIRNMDARVFDFIIDNGYIEQSVIESIVTITLIEVSVSTPSHLCKLMKLQSTSHKGRSEVWKVVMYLLCREPVWNRSSRWTMLFKLLLLRSFETFSREINVSNDGDCASSKRQLVDKLQADCDNTMVQLRSRLPEVLVQLVLEYL